MRKSCMILLLLIMLVIPGCGDQSTIKVVTEKKTYPELDEVASNLENAGFEVERYGSFEEAGVGATRIKAEKDDEYLDLCYDVESRTDLDTIINYYMGNYKRFNLVSDEDVVYCYSSDFVIESAGLK